MVSSSIFEGFLGYSAHVAPSDSSFEVWILMRGCLGRSQLVTCQVRRRMEGAGRLQTQCAALGMRHSRRLPHPEEFAVVPRP